MGIGYVRREFERCIAAQVVVLVSPRLIASVSLLGLVMGSDRKRRMTMNDDVMV